MKKMSFVFLGALALIALAMPSSMAQNLLVNPGFEDPLTSDGAPFVGFWETFQGGGATSAQASTDPLNGASHLSVNINNTNNTFAGAFQDVEGLSPGQLMNFSVWFKTPTLPFDLVSEMRIEWRLVGQVAEVGRTDNLITSPTDAYSLLSLTAAVPPGADTARVVYAIQSFSNTGLPDTGTVFVDDASLTIIPEPATAGLLGLSLLALAGLRRRS